MEDVVKIDTLFVAPLAGARIEIKTGFTAVITKRVAPLAGARIEIVIPVPQGQYLLVAPLAGARIEILELKSSCASSMSLPSRERGLKSEEYA